MTSPNGAGIGLGLAGGLSSASPPAAERKPNADQQRARKDVLWEDVHVAPIVGALGANGTLDQPDMYGPKEGYWWDLRRLTVSGFTAGTVDVYRNTVNGVVLYSFSAAGEKTWSKQQFLGPRDRLIFVVSGLTGSVQIDGQAMEVSAQYMPVYLT